jgi:Holliday junction resolvase-like predicted endonuclease
LALLSGTGKASGASKSSYQLGLEAEANAIQYFLGRGLRLKRQRWRTPFAEVDLVFQGPWRQQLLLVEVKRHVSHEFRQSLLSQRQRRRLCKVVRWLAEAGWEPQLTLVIVGASGEVEEIPEVFVDGPKTFMNSIHS